MNARTAVIRHPAISLPISVAGETVELDWRGGALLRRHQLLIVSDLHLEKGSSLARTRRFLPPYDSHETVRRLAEMIGDHDPAVVVCLGDSFHDPEGHSRLPPPLREALGQLAAGRDWYWIAGNHDPLAPAGYFGRAATELAIGELVLRHEPSPDAAHGEIAGHLHPGAVVRHRGRSLRRPCFAADARRLILPAFGAYTGMLSVRETAVSRLFADGAFNAYLLGESAVYPLAASQLG